METSDVFDEVGDDNPDEIAPYACGMPLSEKCQSTVINGMMVSFDDEKVNIDDIIPME